MGHAVLVTGCNGFVGRHLTARLHESGNVVVGVDLQECPWTGWLDYRRLDIGSPHEVVRLVEESGITRIYHLAAVSNPRIAQTQPLTTMRTNIMGSASFYEACRIGGNTRLLVIGSSEEYLRPNHQNVELTEESQTEASNIYGATKICSELMGKSYAAQFGCHIVFTRSFNHTGPGQAPAFVLSDFARQCALISLGHQARQLHVGNIDVCRDFLDVEDVVEAYMLLLEKGSPGNVYNVSSRRCYSLRELLGILTGFAGRDHIELCIDETRVRVNELATIHGSTDKLHRDTGWVERIPIEVTLKRLFDYWRKRITEEPGEYPRACTS
jgi:GDP-4-dehydro-6-deoxy-D-mannose reductase